MEISGLGSVQGQLAVNKQQIGRDSDFADHLQNAMKQQDNPALRKQCQEFESLMLNMVLQTMRSTVPKNQLFGENSKEEIFRSMLDEEITRKMSQAGGIGLADMLYKQLATKSTTQGPGAK